MESLYWIAGARSWTYIDTRFKIHARIDEVQLGVETIYWWQTQYMSGHSDSWRAAKQEVEFVLCRADGAASGAREAEGASKSAPSRRAYGDTSPHYVSAHPLPQPA